MFAGDFTIVLIPALLNTSVQPFFSPCLAICRITMTPSCSGNADAFIQRFLARVPPDVARTFSPAQLAVVQHAFGMRYAPEHIVEVRRSVRLPWGRYYLVLLFGRDRPEHGRARRCGAVLLVRATVALVVAIAALMLLSV